MIPITEAVARLRAEVLPEMKERAREARGIDAFEATRDVLCLMLVLDAADAFSLAVQHISARPEHFGTMAPAFLGGMMAGLKSAAEKECAALAATEAR